MEKRPKNNESHLLFNKVKEVKEDGNVRFRLTAKEIDRFGEVVMPKGGDLKNYKKNPVVLWAHNFDMAQPMVPIGKLDISSIEVTDDYLDADIIFDDDDPFAKMIGDKVRNGFLSAGSIGFRTIEVSNEPVLPKQPSVTITKWELMEFSIVPVPALPSALAQREWRDLQTTCEELGHPIKKHWVDEYFTKAHDPTTETITLTYEAIKDLKRMVVSEREELELKAGKVLSAKNIILIENAISKIDSLKDTLETLLKSAQPQEEEEEADSKILEALDQLKDLASKF